MSDVIQLINQYMPYLNIAFYVLILLPVLISGLIGLSRGFKKGVWIFVLRIIYLVIFITTLNLFANWIYTANLYGGAQIIGTAITGISDDSITSLKDLVGLLSSYYLSNLNGINLDTAYVTSLIGGFVVYIVKIVWGILYFIIIVPLFRLIMSFFYKGFVRGKVEYRKVNKDPALGMIMGVLNGLICSFIIMVFFGGLVSLVSYTGEIQVSEPVAVEEDDDETSTTTAVSEVVLRIGDEEYTILLTDESTSPLGSLSILGEVPAIANELKTFTNTWNNNIIVKMANNVYIKTDSGTVDEEGDKIYIREKSLEKVFDELIYIKYTVLSEEEDGTDLNIKINYFSDINKIINAALYILDDNDLIDTSGNIDFSNLSSERVEAAFKKLSEVKLLKVGILVGLNFAINNYADTITQIDLTDTDLQNQLYETDWTGDIAKLGNVLGALIDGGAGEILQEYMEGSLDTSNILNTVLSVIKPAQEEGETSEDYLARVSALQTKIKTNITGLNLLVEGSSILSSYLVDNILNSYVEQYNLDDADLNKALSTDTATYKQKLIDTMNLADDAGVIFDLLFDTADFNDGENNYVSYLINNYQDIYNLIDTGATDLSMDDISTFMNTVFSDLSDLSFLQAGLDIAVKILSETMTSDDTTSYKQYLSETNLFSSYIDWQSELGTKIPNLVNALIDADIFSLVKDSSNILSILWEKTSLEDYLSDTINALFSLQIISNLEDTALSPLITSYVDSLSSDAFKIKMRNDIGEEGHTYKDEILLLLSLVDDLVSGAKEKGATSFNDMFDTSNLNYLIGGISNIDAVKLESSSILAPSIIYFLSNLDNDYLKVPYIYEDPLWYTTYQTDTEGDFVLDGEGHKIVVSYGELYNIVSGLQAVATNQDLIDLITGNSEGEGTDQIFDIIKSINSDDIETLFNSVTIQASVSTLLNDFGSGEDSSFSIIVPSTSKETVTISNYNTEDDVTISSSSYIVHEDSEGNAVNVYTAQAKYIKSEEFTYIVDALLQISDFGALMDSETMMDQIKDLDSDSEDSAGNPFYDTDGITVLSKTDVMFRSDIIRCTISYFLTGDDYSDNYFVYPVEDMQLVDGSYYISKDAVSDLFSSIFVIVDKIDSLDNIGTSLINDLLDLSSSEIEDLFSSGILNATISNLLSKQDAITIPIKAYNAEGVLTDVCTLQDVLPLDGADFTEKYLVSGTELENLIKSMQIAFPAPEDESADRVDIDNLGNNISDYLSNMLNLDDAELSSLFNSSILRATLSILVTQQDALVIPVSVVQATDVLVYDSADEEDPFSTSAKWVITVNDLKQLMKTLGEAFPEPEDESEDRINLDSSFDIDQILNNILEIGDQANGGNEMRLTNLFQSTIFRATLSSYITDVDSIIIPESSEGITIASLLNIISYNSDTEVYSTDTQKYVLSTDECKALIKSLSTVFPDSGSESRIDTENFDTTEMMNNILTLNDTKLNSLFSSAILRATMSKQIVEIDSIVVPVQVKENYSSLSETAVVESTPIIDGETLSTANKYVITKADLVNIIKALNVVFKGGMDNIGTIDYENMISDLLKLTETDLETLFKSNILRATISKQIIETSAIDTPYLLENDPSTSSDDIYTSEFAHILKVEDGIESTSEEKYVIYLDECTAMIKSLSVLFPDEVTISTIGTDSVSDLLKLSDSELDTLFDSNILRATLSAKIMDSDSITIPISYMSLGTRVYVVGESSKIVVAGEIYSLEDSYVINTEDLVDLVKALGIVFDGAVDINSISIDNFKSLSATSDADLDILTASVILDATISEKITDAFGSGSTQEVIIPYTSTESYLQNASGVLLSAADNSRMITGIELKNTIRAMGYLDFTSLGSSTSAFDSISQLTKSSNISGRTQIEVILDSGIMQATLSDVILKMSTSTLSLSIPNEVLDITSFVSSISGVSGTYDINGSDIEIISETEIENMINALNYIDIDSFSSGANDNGIFDTIKALTDYITLVGAERKVDMVFDSEILLATISSYILKMNLSSLEISVPLNSDVLMNSGDASLTDPYLYYNISDQSSAQATTYIIKKEEMKNFIIGAASLDLDKLSTDKTGAIKSLNDESKIISGKTNIQLVLESQILRLTISSYLITNITDLGFTSFVFPSEDLTLISSVKYDTITEAFISSNKYEIEGIKDAGTEDESWELERLITGIYYLDIDNVGSDTMNVVATLNDPANNGTGLTKLETINLSDILRYTISGQIVLQSNSASGGFNIPHEAYVQSGGSAEEFYVYDPVSETLDTNTVTLIKANEIQSMVEVLYIVDIQNFTPNEVLTLDSADIAAMLESMILHTTISKRLRDMLEANTSVWPYYNTYMETTEITYTDGVDEINAISASEILSLFNSLQILGQTDYETFSVSIDNLALLTNDGNTLNDDDPANDDSDTRAKFLRSILIRSILTGETADMTAGASRPDSYEGEEDPLVTGTKDYLKVSFITTYVDALYNASWDSTPADSSLTISALGILSFNPVTATGYTPQYRIYINGALIDTVTTTSVDISSHITDVGSYRIQVVATLLTATFTPPYYANYTPYNYEEEVVTNTASLSDITDASIDVDGNLTFTGNGGDTYTIRFYEDGTLVLTKVLKKTNAGGTVSMSLSGLLAPGIYTYSIQVEANEAYYLDSSEYTNGTYTYTVRETLDNPQIEVIGSKIYFTGVTNAAGYKITINGVDYTSFIAFSVTDGPSGYYLDLAALIPSVLPYGQYTVVLTTTNSSFYDNGSASVTLNVLSPVDTITKVIDNSGESEVIKISWNAVEHADKYIVRVYRLSDETDLTGTLCLYKEVSTNFLDVTSLLKKGYAYRVVIEAISTNNPYITNTADTETSATDTLETIYMTKALSEPVRHIVSDTYVLSFNEVENAEDYSIIIYTVGTDDTLTIFTTDTSAFVYTVNEGIVSVDLTQAIFGTFTDGTKYKVVVKALSTSSQLYESSDYSVGTTFTYSPS